jgi:hypothetical protein
MVGSGSGIRIKHPGSATLTYTVKKGHERNFSSELIHILLLKTQKVSNILMK